MPVELMKIRLGICRDGLNDRHEVVVRARGSTWILDILKREMPDLYAFMLGSQQNDPDALREWAKTVAWTDIPGWTRVAPEPCEVCGAYQMLCAFDEKEAIYFIENEGTNTFAHLCGEHGNMMDENEVELGSYAETDGCSCDYWK